MDPTCWKIVGGMGTAVLGMATAVLALWKAYSKTNDLLLAEKEEKVRILAELKVLLERRRKP